MYKSQSARRTVFGEQRNNAQPFPTAGSVPATTNYGAGKIPETPAPVKEQNHLKNAATPPLPRQNSKAIPPSPPAVIRDMGKSLMFTRMGLLGEGGFARVYEVKDMKGIRMAIKVVTKASLKTKKAKTKLYAEIKIHKSLQHPNIVRFNECFEDTDNVYMTLELCESGSVMDMLRRRRRFTEPEARLFMVQVIGACNFMHNNQIIHRDLKLGNLFLDSNMNIKVGDFGLAALIENPGERKKTICGTPNYIAPEILFDTANGHSFEVDTWSIGVILYTLVIGRPPFQTKDVKTIYKRIRDNQYDWPVDKEVSPEAKELVQQILTSDPQARPTLINIIEDIFFTSGPFPGFIPPTAKDIVPDFRHISRQMTIANFTRARKQAWLDEDITVPSPEKPTPHVRQTPATALAEQEREFQRAVQPGSPISALLSSARQPLVVSAPTQRGEVPLIRKLQQAAPRERLASSAGVGGRPVLANIQEEGAAANIVQQANDPVRKRELESQKARIVAQMVPNAQVSTTNNTTANALTTSATTTMAYSGTMKNLPSLPSVREGVDENVPPSETALPPTQSTKSLARKVSSSLSSKVSSGQLNAGKAYDTFARTLQQAFHAKKEGKLFRDPSRDAQLPQNRVFIVSWVDYCNKYGMGYALTDGSVGVYFNDGTTMLLAADKHHIDFLPARKSGIATVAQNYTLEEFPDTLKNKIYLLKHFQNYMMDRLYGEYKYCFQDTERIHGMDYVVAYLRMKQVIVFKLSHDALQFNFCDHSKLILSSQGLVVTHIDKHYNLTRWTLSDIMRRALLPPPTDPEEARFEQKLLEKLRYATDLLQGITSASSSKSTTTGSSVADSMAGR